MVTRRDFFASGAAVAVVAVALELVPSVQGPSMYGVISRIQATPGQRDALASILVEGSAGMPGCLSYVVARDLGDPDSLWVTEVWDSQASLVLRSRQFPTFAFNSSEEVLDGDRLAAR